MKIDDLPFHLGGTDSALNPAGLPSTFPFALFFDEDLGVLRQRVNTELNNNLERAYREGILIGTPLDSDDYGRPYADDFLDFISQLNLSGSPTALEIGAGVGYLTHRLNSEGIKTIGLEPGTGYSQHWKKHKVEILNDFFPSKHIQKNFDLIVSYAVLEHIADPKKFLTDIRDHLATDGIAVLAVPDCTTEIIKGDPSILFHEHFNYFDAGSLGRLIESIGMKASVKKSNFGRCLYATVSHRDISKLNKDYALPPRLLATYPERCTKYINHIRKKISAFANEGTIGVYCAARGLPFLDPTQPMRFFDDDPAQQNRYLPPFLVSIKSHKDLLNNPVTHLIVMSRTFGKQILENLRRLGYQGQIHLLEEM